MEIHKPRPVHSWREFLTEIGVVVIGVCIALAAEQTVEWWHWRNQVQEARQAIHAEIVDNEANLFARRFYYKPCVDCQRQESEAILADLEAGRPPGHFTTFHLGSAGATSTGEWEAQRAAQTLAHFPSEELAMLARHYEWLTNVRGFVAAEDASLGALSVLRGPPKGLGPSDFMRLRGNLSDASHAQDLIDIYVLRALKLGEALGIPRPPQDMKLQVLFCSKSESEYLQTIRAGEAGQRPTP